jgi:hypothetical protein
MSKTPKLNQVLAIEKGIKQRSYQNTTSLHQQSKKPSLFSGFSKVYEPVDEEGQQFPPESQRVQATVPGTIKSVRRSLVELFDIVATKDAANQEAKADVVVDGETLAEGIPATTLLFLEKQLSDLSTFVRTLPVLDSQFEWHLDEAVNLHKTKAVKTHKTKKVQKPIVLFPATDKHPAQTQLITEDEIVGHWNTIKQSGAIPVRQRDEMLERILTLTKAVKYAREAANSQEAPKQKLGESILDYVFKK